MYLIFTVDSQDDGELQYNIIITIILGVYLMACNILLLNMLIAMFRLVL